MSEGGRRRNSVWTAVTILAGAPAFTPARATNAAAVTAGTTFDIEIRKCRKRRNASASQF
jgi:hypothetical protein